MLANFLSSPWFALLMLVVSLGLLCAPVAWTSRRLRAAQLARERAAMDQAATAMEAWRKSRPGLQDSESADPASSRA